MRFQSTTDVTLTNSTPTAQTTSSLDSCSSVSSTEALGNSSPRTPLPLVRLVSLAVAAVGIHGYHLACDDAAIYLPAVKRVIDPHLYPFEPEFFLSHARFSHFASLVGWTARTTHIDADLAIFLWYLATVLATVIAGWQLANVVMTRERSRWSAVIVFSSVLTVPVSGTALAMMDPYLTARSASTPMVLFAVAALLAGKRRLAWLWIALAILAHPMMGISGAALLALMSLPERWPRQPKPANAKRSSPAENPETIFATRALSLPIGLGPITPAYRQAIEMRPFLFLARWKWYEWIGLAAPLAILHWITLRQPRAISQAGIRVARAAVLLGCAATLAAAVLSLSPAFDPLVRLQPLRAFHVIYCIFFILLGGLLGKYLLQGRLWLSASFFLLLGTGMSLVQIASYPSSPHIELPWSAPRNPWVQAFLWIRHNTPKDAVFALDPNYIELPGEDRHGFRAISERSALTDAVKDSGVVSLFPQLAESWQAQQKAQESWTGFALADFQRLAQQYPVTWVVLQGPPPNGLACPYRNAAVTVCRIPGATGLPATNESELPRRSH